MKLAGAALQVSSDDDEVVPVFMIGLAASASYKPTTVLSSSEDLPDESTPKSSFSIIFN